MRQVCTVVGVTIALSIGLLCPPNRLSASSLFDVLQSEQAFEVATIKPAEPGLRKIAAMQSAHQFVVRNYRVKDLLAFAYNLPARLVSGGPAWVETDAYDILASAPGAARPTLDEQQAMMRRLLADRFHLTYHM